MKLAPRSILAPHSFRGSLAFLIVANILGMSPAVISPAVAQDAEVSKKEINAAYRSPNSLIRHETWTKLNPENKSQLKILLQILQKRSWYDRQGAINALATAASDDVIEKVVKYLEKHKDPAVRQGMAAVLAKMNDDQYYPALYKALDDKDPLVRRTVIHSLRVRKKNEAVDALVQRFRKEKDPSCKSFLEKSLNQLTQAFKGPNPIAWLAWWEAAKNDPDYELGETDEEAEKAAEDLGLKLKKRKTVSVGAGVTLESEEKGGGDGVPILVLPHYGRSQEIFKPFLGELERNHKLYYINIPTIAEFKGLPTVGATGLPEYPTEKYVEAFEDLRKETGEDHFAIMSAGMNAWIGMTYAEKHPRSVAALLFVAPLASRKAYGDATDRFVKQGQASKDTEMHYFGLGRRVNPQTGKNHLDEYKEKNSIKTWEGESGCVDRRSWSLYFADDRDTFIGELYPIKSRPLGGVIIPDFDLFKRKKPSRRIPTLVITGKASLYNTTEESKAIAKFYGGICLEYRKSSCMPFYEESERFNKDVSKFLKKFTRKKKKKSSSKKR